MTGARPHLPATAGAALLLAAVLIGALVVASTALTGAGAESGRLQRALAVTDAFGALAARGAEADMAELELRQSPLLDLGFVAASGGVDDFGIDRGAALSWGADRAGALAPALLEHARAVQSAGEEAQRQGRSIEAGRLVRRLADGRQLVAVPFRARPGGAELAGVAGVVVRAPAAEGVSPLIWLMPLLIAGLAVALGRLAPLGAASAGAAAMALGGAAALLLLPAPGPAAGPGVEILASDWLVPHGAVGGGVLETARLWLYGGAAALALLLGVCVPGLASVLSALRRDPAPYAYVGPAVLATGVLVFVPFAVGVGLSFVDREGGFLGLANYVEVLTSIADPNSSTHFFRTLGMTVLWTVLNVAFHVGLGLALALVLDARHLRGRKVYRLLLIVPWAVPSYITALTWKWLFNTQYGPINAMLDAVGVAPVDWLGNSVVTNFAANLATNVWLGFPFMMVVSLGALQSIPAELYEAASIDGASAWQRFRHVTLPLLRPALFPAVILGTIWTFNAFNVIYLVSGGGPEQRTDILITEAYYAFTVLRRTGLAAAYSVLIFVLLLGYTMLTSRKTRATEAVNA